MWYGYLGALAPLARLNNFLRLLVRGQTWNWTTLTCPVRFLLTPKWQVRDLTWQAPLKRSHGRKKKSGRKDVSTISVGRHPIRTIPLTGTLIGSLARWKLAVRGRYIVIRSLSTGLRRITIRHKV